MKLFDVYRKNDHIFLPVYKIQNRKSEPYIDEFSRIEKLSDYECEEVEFRRVKEIVNYAYEHVNFYKNLYQDAGIDPAKISDWEDFKKLPYISKKDIKGNLKSFLSDEFNKIDHRVCYTGGSQDAPMEFYLDKSILDREQATFTYYWEKNGYQYGKDRCVLFRGDRVANVKKEKFYSSDQLSNYRRFDCRYINNYFRIYDSQIKAFNARFMQAYPSSAYLLASLYEKSDIIPPRFDVIFLGSENTSPEKIQIIKDVFNAKDVVYHYGHSECVLFASKYHDKDYLGFYPQYGHVELVNINSSGVGEIVGTSFSKSMPFIRYKTNDFAELTDYRSEDYMRHCIAVKRIEGRKQDYFVTKGKNLIPIAVFSHLREFNLIEGEFQYYQKEEGVVELCLQKIGENASDRLQNMIKNCVSDATNNEIEIRFSFVDEIKKSRNGKLILMQQELNTDKYR